MVPPIDVNQVSVHAQDTFIITAATDNFGSFFQTLNSNQCQQLMSLLSSQMVSHGQSSSQENSINSHTTGTCFSVVPQSLLSDTKLWIIDSGASRHICANRSMFHNLHAVPNSSVMLPDNSCFSVYFSGDVPLSTSLTLKDVLYVPTFKFNLLSISALTRESSVSVSFFPESFVIQDSSQKVMIGKGSRFDDLYVLHSKDLIPATLSTSVNASPAFVNKVSFQTWHNRLGHLSDQRLAVLNKLLHCDYLNNNIHTSCYICPLAKQRRLPFVSHNHMASHPFDLLHCDIWGPYRVTSHSGFRYFLTLVDDCTRFTWVYLLKNKCDAIQVVPRFFSMIDTQFHKIIKVFRSDNAKELQFTDFFIQKGVIHQYSCVE